MLYVLSLAGLIFVIGFILNTPWFKGCLEKLLVHLTNSLCLDKKVYHILKNVTFTSEDETTQIDRVIVSKYGIFVVETKNSNGLIYGTEYDARWTIMSHNIYQIPNPLWQNYKRKKTLAELLNIPDNKFWSLIALTGDSTCNMKLPENVTTDARAYLAYIKSQTEIILSQEEVKYIVEQIEAHRGLPDSKTLYVTNAPVGKHEG